VTIEQQLRSYIDDPAPALTLDEVKQRGAGSPDGVGSSSPTRSRPWLAAATLAIIVGVGGALGTGIIGGDGDEAVLAGDGSLNPADAAGSLELVADAADATVGSWELVADAAGAFLPLDMVEGTVDTSDEPEDRINVNAITATDDGFFAVGAERELDGSTIRAAVWSSVDGLSWERVDPESPLLNESAAEPGDQSPSGYFTTNVASHGRTLVVVGAKILDRIEPTVWRKAPDQGWERFMLPNPSETLDIVAHQVVATPHGFTAVGLDFREADDSDAVQVLVWTSPDGAEWTLANGGFGPGERIEAMENVGDRIVAVGSRGGTIHPVAAAWTSDDGGRTWVAASVPTADEDRPVTFMADLARGPNGLVAIGHQLIEESFEQSFEEGGVTPEDLPDIALWTSNDDGQTWRKSATIKTPGEVNTDARVIWGPAGYLLTSTTVTLPNEVSTSPNEVFASAWLTMDGTAPTEIGAPPDRGLNLIAATPEGYVSIARPLLDHDEPASGAGTRSDPAHQIWHLPVS